MVEMRLSKRIALNCDALLVNREHCVFGKIRNANQYGLYIEIAENDIRFAKNTVIQVRYHDAIGEERRSCSLKAVVVHHNSNSNSNGNGNGIGLKVDTAEPNAKRNVNALIAQGVRQRSVTSISPKIYDTPPLIPPLDDAVTFGT